MAAELIEHPKEIAEHIMLVDLARNDVGRVVEFGSVSRRRDDDARALQPRHAHDLAGVRAAAPTARSAIDVLRATLPAGTVSGAPKVRAMEIIDELEPTKRGPYAGVVGYLDFSGNIDTAIAIRTLVVGGRRPGLGAGRGRHRGRQRARARGPRVPQQGPGPARGHPRRSAHDGPPPHPRRRTRRRPLDSVTAMAPWRRPAHHPGSRADRARRRARRGTGGDRLPPGAAQPGRRRRWRVGRVGAVAPPPADREGRRLAAGHPRRRTTPSCSTSTPGFGEAVLARLAALQAADQGRPVARAMVGPGLARPRARRRSTGRAGALSAVAGWPGVEGVDLLSSGELALAGVPLVDPAALEALRIECGVPAMGAELTEATIPAEAGQWLIDASVSFTKGCYTGQELVARIDSRGGNVPRPLRGLSWTASPSSPGATVWNGDVEVGTVTSARPFGRARRHRARAPRSLRRGRPGRRAAVSRRRSGARHGGRPADAVNDRAAP